MKFTIPQYREKDIRVQLDDLQDEMTVFEETIEYTVSPVYNKSFQLDGKSRILAAVDIEITNPQLTINGFTIIGRITHSKTNKPVFDKVYPINITHDIDYSIHCQHCNVKYRKYTYVLLKDDNELVYIAETCINNFLGLNSSVALKHAKLFIQLTNIFHIEQRKIKQLSVEAQPLDTFLMKCIQIINEKGYVSGKQAREQNEINNKQMATGLEAWDNKQTTFDDTIIQTCDEVIKWVVGLTKHSSYIQSIKELVDYKYVTYRTATTAASMVGVWKNNHEQQMVENEIVSNHFGTVGERIELNVTVEHITTYDGTYGTNNRYKLRTDDGNVAIWFTTNNGLKVDKKYYGKCTISKHSVFNGIQQTILTRCKLIEIT